MRRASTSGLIRIGALMAVLPLVTALSFGAAAADSVGSVKVNAVFTDYPENLEETPWDIGRLRIRASEPDRGTIRADNPYQDWKYVSSLDPIDFGLDPETDMKAYFKDALGWTLEADVVCVNVIGNRAVLGAQVTRITGVFGEEWLGTWMGLELFDMDEFGEPDYYEDLRYDPDTGEGPTEADVRSWCAAGDVPVPPDWFYYQRELLSGGIEVTG